jgi:hypothetical protein
MDPFFLLQLDRFRDRIAIPFEVTAGFATSGHQPKSYHYIGRAVDGRFLDLQTKKALPMISQFILAMKSPFSGCGLYTWWPNGPGVHLDNRDGSEHRAIWVSREPNVYEPLSLNFLDEILKEIP